MREENLQQMVRLLKDDDKCTLELTIKLLQQLVTRLVENPSDEDTTPKRRWPPIFDDDDDLEKATKPLRQRPARGLDEDDDLEKATTPKPVEDHDYSDGKPSPAEREAFQARCRPNKENVEEILTHMMDEKFSSVIVIGQRKDGQQNASCVGFSPQQAVEILEDIISMALADEDFYK